jgi:hypothetical protein
MKSREANHLGEGRELVYYDLNMVVKCIEANHLGEGREFDLSSFCSEM